MERTLETRFQEPNPVYEGTFGCTLRVKDASTEQHERRAIKIQYVKANDNETEKRTRSEVQLAKQLASVVQDRIAPCVIKTYEIIQTQRLPQSWITTIRGHCPNFYRNSNLSAAAASGDYYILIVMELADKGSLKNYLNHLSLAHRACLSSHDLRSINFQIVWTMNTLQRIYGLRHFDLKLDNIVIANCEPPGTRIFKLEASPYNLQTTEWMLSSGLDPKLIDFGLSKVAKTCQSGATQLRPEGLFISDISGTESYMDPAAFFVEMYRKQKDEHVRRNLDSDMWSIGLISIDLALAGWEKPVTLNHDAWPDNELWSPRRFKNALLFHSGANNATKTEFRVLCLFLESNAGLSKDGSSVVVGMCLLNQRLGNGLLPSAQDWPELKTSKLWVALHTPKQLSILRTMANSGIYSHIINRVRARMGAEGLDFIKRLLSWSPSARARFGYSESINPAYLMLSLRHSYFNPLRVNKYSKRSGLSSSSECWLYDENKTPPVRIIKTANRPATDDASPSSSDIACFLCGRSTTMQCSRCKVYSYCSSHCQQIHWKGGHRTACSTTTVSMLSRRRDNE